MKNLILFFLAQVISIIVSAQSHQQIINMTPSNNIEFYRQMLNQAQKNLEDAISYTSQIKDYINLIKQETNDVQLNKELNTYNKDLDNNLNREFPSVGAIQLIEQKLNESIANYNIRVRDANDPNKYWDAAIENLKKGNNSGALINLNKVMELAPEFPASYYYRGLIFFNNNDFPSSIRDFDKYISLNTNDPAGYDRRGWAKYYQSDYNGALLDFTKQVTLDPLSSDAYYNRGSAKSELNDQEGAIRDYKKSIELEPKYSMAYNNLAWSFFKLKKYTEALTYANVSIDLDNENSVAFDTRAEIKFNMGDNKGCIEDCNSALKIDYELSNSYFLRARAKYKTGDKIGACEDWRIAGGFGKAEAYEFIGKYCK